MAKRFRRIAALSVTGVVVAGGAGTAYAARSSSGPVYRLATVTSADVTAAPHMVGTLTPVRQGRHGAPGRAPGGAHPEGGQRHSQPERRPDHASHDHAGHVPGIAAGVVGAAAAAGRPERSA